MNSDKLGNPIEVGDTVVFGEAQHMNLLTGSVMKISPKTVKIEYTVSYVDYYTKEPYLRLLQCNRTFDNVVVVNKNIQE